MKYKLLISTAIVALLSLPAITFAQAPTLGTAAGFVLFSSNGAVTNTGLSHVTGNVGTNNGSSTGFGNVDGVMHDGDGSSAQCSADLLIAYNQLNATTSTFFPAPLLGNGQTLVPGVYAISSAATLNGVLNLNAQNNPNSVFIIKIQGSFSTNAASKVKLLNGALACNVFWKIEGMVSMATGTSMKGTVIANNAAISLNTGDTLEGRALSTTGAVTTNGVLVYTPIGCGSPVLRGPAAPSLGSAECYEIFSSSGTVSNSGITHVTGDVGTNSGTVTGFDTALVSGRVHTIPDASTAQCAADLHNAYTYLNTLPYNIQLLYPAQFGNDLVLTPHCYLLNGATVLTGNVYLNAEGDSNAVFVIKINGALSTSTYARVVLINGTQAKNVYWKIEGAVSINNYSIFCGTIVCNNGALNALNTGVVINGRAFTTGGSITTNAITATMPPGCTAGAPSIATEPTDQTGCSGSAVSFTVIAHGSSLTYRWRKGAINLSNGGNISGATSAILTIDPISASDAANNYNVIISGSSAPADTSDNASLTVNTAPHITSAPTDHTACSGSSINIAVAGTGTGLSYQWKKGNVNLTNSGNISGATSPTLTINPARMADAATNYNVIISGTCAPSDTSGNVALTVNTPLSITTAPVSQTACPGSPASFNTGATGSGLTYQWRKGNVNLVSAGNISGANTSTLTINPVTVANAGTDYNVVITGACAPAATSSNVSLTLCSSAGIASIDRDMMVSVYPNPFRNSLTISMNDPSMISNCEWKLYNILGMEIMSVGITKSLTIIATADLPSGIYIYKVISNNAIMQSGRLTGQE